jgi:ABC-type phosphate/phosphonate transport system substrate-binding protein
MLTHGLDPKRDLSSQMHVTTPLVVPAVLNGQVDAGAVFEEGLSMFTHSPAEKNSLYVIARVGPIANGMFVCRGNLPPAEIKQLQAAMATINTDPMGIAANKALDVNKWDKANDKVFDPVRKAAKVIGLNLQSLDKK